MDLHRSRFVPYPSSAINTLAFSSSGKAPSDVKLAIGRANGNIEIWNPLQGAWACEIVLTGGKDRSVEGLAWIQEPDTVEVDTGVTTAGQFRLFSIGYSSSVTEWDLTTGLPLQHSSGNHSEVWCIAAQPREVQNKSPTEGYSGQNIVAGCADGTLVLLSTTDGELRFQKHISRPTGKRSRVLSLAFQNRNTIVAGYADSTIRVYDWRNGKLIRTISLGTATAPAPREILVWAVKCLPNGDIVSGDSSGEVRFFDGRSYTQLQHISGHEADILDIATSRDGQIVYSAGMDRRTTVYNLQGGKRWAKIASRRYHEHDVKTMAVYESRSMSVVASGGVDTNLLILPLRQFCSENHRTLSGLPQTPPVASAPEARVFLSWWNREIRIWQLHERNREEEQPKLLSKLMIKGEENISSVSISGDGKLLAVGTSAEVKVFRVSTAYPRILESNYSLDGRTRKVHTPPDLQKLGARLVQFSADGKWLAVVTHQNSIILARVVKHDESRDKWKVLPRVVELKRLTRIIKTPRAMDTPWNTYNQIITRITFSSDSKVLVASDIGGTIDSWVIEGHEDPSAPEIDEADAASSASSSGDEETHVDEKSSSLTFLGQHWRSNPSGHLVPKLDSTPLILSIQPLSPKQIAPEPNGNPAVHPTRNNPHPHSVELPNRHYLLFVLTAKHQIYEFDLLDGKLSDWSRRNPSSSLPNHFRYLRDRTMGAMWHISNKFRRIWLYGSNWLFMLDLSRDLPIEDLAAKESYRQGEDLSSSKKRKRGRSRKDASELQSSGAGNKMPPEHIQELRSNFHLPDGVQPVPASQGNTLEDEDNTTAQQTSSALTSLRRSTVNKQGMRDGDEERFEGLAYWYTHKYQPILGMAPISTPLGIRGHGVNRKGKRIESALEAIVVERPLWDLDLPPRFVGAHERD
ncbi:WD40 repeat-like protein [Patellaria atrata CBS 101060]|uniref:WD40 repeat-like protein n=1 Tax=Patellaria atrata CBS 101060 TaxID=1346257 RepID=A0A9P4S2W2_9PEZI|nr:WD40 repeat-like protein [Patellaria atrata CBS 101060]